MCASLDWRRRGLGRTRTAAYPPADTCLLACAQAQLADCQFRQFVDALQLIFANLDQVSAGNEVNRGWWKAGGRARG